MGAPDRDGRNRRAIHTTEVAGHARPRGVLRTVRVRILAPVLVAAIGVAALGLIQVNAALADVTQANQASALAAAARPIGALAHAVALEYVTTNEARRNGAPTQDLDRQRAETDARRVEFDAVADSIRTSAPALGPLVQSVDRSVRGLGAARDILLRASDGSAEVRAYYDSILVSLLALAEGIPAQLSDPRLVELARSIAIVAGLDRLTALQLDLVARALAAHEVASSEYTQLAEWVGNEQAQLTALSNLHPASELSAALSSRVVVATATSIRQVIVDSRGDPAALRTDPGTWFTAQSRRLEGVWEMEQDLAGRLTNQASALGSAARQRAIAVGGISLAVVSFTLAAAGVMAVRITRRLRRTRYAALTAARVELPTAIANVIAAHDATSVRAALTDSSGRIDALLPAGPDEIGELATAFGAVHRQALRLAADQALLRMEVQALFVALSRRGQTLIQRQIHLIDEFSRNEADPDVLARLFALDHLAARMRRNEENLLVLSGGEPGRWITRPVALHDLIRAAAQEIEEYQRIEIGDLPGVAVTANVAGDAIHLLAELLENATNYSPPRTTVRVSARRTMGGLEVFVVDEGIGMPDRQLTEANDRLAHPSALTSTLVGTMGLLVVARLAQRHGVQVRLTSVAAGGTTATVVLPDLLVVPLGSVERLQPGPWLRDLDGRPQPAVEAPSGPQHRAPVEAAVTSLPPATDRHRTGLYGTPPALPAAAPVPTPLPTPLPAPLPAPPAAAPTAPPAAIRRTQAPLTAAGLPRRPPEAPPPAAAAGPAPASMPDPEAIRARLSSLALGIAAANQGAPPPPAHPDSDHYPHENAEARMAP